MSYGQDTGKKKKLAVYGLSSLLLVAMVVAVTVNYGTSQGNGETSSSAHTANSGLSTSTKAIKSICQTTDYKKSCEESLQSEAGNSTDHKKLVKAAFKATMKKIELVANHSVLLKEVEKDPRAKEALDNCKELMGSAVDDLKDSISEVGSFDSSKIEELLDNIKTWLSATITDQETCLDGFANTTSEAGGKMKKVLNASMELSSNGLAIVEGLSSMLSQLDISTANGRRLLQDSRILGHGELPMGAIESPWVKRRLFEDVLGHGENPVTDEDFEAGTRRRLLAAGPANIKADFVVAKDGSGQYKTINDALKAIPKKSAKTIVLYIKEGVYNEQVEIDKSLTHLYMIGDGATKTRITGNKNFVDGVTTYRTATVAVVGDFFMAKDIGFENSAGAIKHQAVALRVQSDQSIFYRCAMDGYQDTLYTHSKRQFYRECTITGTIDFVFGDGPVVFQNCIFLCRKPLDNQQCIVTAQGRKERRQPSALILQNSTISSSAEFYPLRNTMKAFLGRPWKEYSRTIIMESYIDDLIQPEGWTPWLGNFGLNTLFYAEFNNRGPGAATAKRVAWRGIKKIDKVHAQKFTAKSFIWGDTWVPKTGVQYTSGLMQ